MESNKILSADILDLIFENRNKDYGAYELRKTYPKRIRNALIITTSIAVFALLGSLLASSLDNGKKSKLNIMEVKMEDIKQEEKKIEPPPPPPPKVEPPKIEMTKFTPPKIVKDEEVKKEEIPPEVEELKDTKIDIVSQEGIKDQGIVVPVQIDEGKKVIEEKNDDENKIFEKVEIEAQFKGGDKAWTKYLQRNLNPNTPAENDAPEGTYTVWVQFVVNKEGVISDVKALTTKGYGMEEEAIKVIKKGPNWEPAIQNGRKVNAYRKQPITFVYSGE